MPDRPATFRDLIQHEAESQGIPPALAFAVVDAESGGNPNTPPGALTPGGRAQGLFQLMPATAQAYGLDPTDPLQNVKGGIRLLSELNSRYQGDVSQIVAAYHGGLDPKNHGPLTRHYVETILGKLAAPPAGTPTAAAPRGTTFRANPGQAAALVGAPPPAPLPEYGKGMTPADPTQFEGPSTRLQEVTAAGKSMLAGFDPRTRSGRRNIASGVGGTITGTLGSPSGPGAAAAAIAGAGVAGALETSIENLIAGDHQNQIENPVIEGAKQAGTEALGQGIAWPVQAVGRRLVASKVGQNAAAGLKATRDATMAGFDRAIDAAKTHGRAVKTQTARALRSATTAAADAVWNARSAGREAVDAAAQRGQAGVDAALAAVDSTKARAAGLVGQAVEAGQGMVGAPPPRTVVGRKAGAVIEGPARSVLDSYGQAVEEAAQSGPALPLTATKAKAQGIFDRQIKDLETYFSGKGEQLDPELAGYLSNAFSKGVGDEDKAAFMTALKNAGVETGLAEATFESARHPAMGVLRRIVNAPGEIPFAAAHQLKKHLDEAVDWQSPARTLVKQGTKGIRSALREELAVHEPYNTATARYASTVPLFNKGMAKTIRRTAQEEPGAFLSRLRPDAPEQARMLREILTDVPAKGEDAAGVEAGRQAWNGIRAAWTHGKLIKGDVSTLGDRIAQLEGQSPEFVSTLYGDTDGQVVLKNLKAIAAAIKGAEEEGRILTADAVARVEGAKGSKAALLAEARKGARQSARGVALEGRQAVEGVRQAGENARAGVAAQMQGLRTARRTAQAPTDDELAFEMSSLFPDRKPRALDEHLADFIRGFALGPSTFWGAYSIGRLMRGPASADLVEWAAYSPAGTRALVGVLTSPAPGTAAANLYRTWQGQQQTQAEVEGQQAPRRGLVGTPPPGR